MKDSIHITPELYDENSACLSTCYMGVMETRGDGQLLVLGAPAFFSRLLLYSDTRLLGPMRCTASTVLSDARGSLLVLPFSALFPPMSVSFSTSALALHAYMRVHAGTSKKDLSHESLRSFDESAPEEAEVASESCHLMI